LHLRQGKTKSIVEASVDAALLAVEIYNKPRTTFRSQSYITMMMIAWTYIFHAYFNLNIGQKYFYKLVNGRYQIIDGEKKAWELRTCINKYGKLSEAVQANLGFFIGLRNKIEHRSVGNRDVDAVIFGECQSLLYNYETTLASIFGEDYSINENLVYSLQFSRLRTPEQSQANRKALSSQMINITDYIDKYRNTLADSIFNSQEYSVKLIQIPKISNTDRSDLAIEFVMLNEVDDDHRKFYEELRALVKDKVVIKEGANIGKLKPSQVLSRVRGITGISINHYDHKCLYTVFSIRPSSPDCVDPFSTDTRYCHFDEAHGDYVFNDAWVSFIADAFLDRKFDKSLIKTKFQSNKKLSVENYI
jgi:hypothetical protein